MLLFHSNSSSIIPTVGDYFRNAKPDQFIDKEDILVEKFTTKDEELRDYIFWNMNTLIININFTYSDHAWNLVWVLVKTQ